jgi:hypothetical protein
MWRGLFAGARGDGRIRGPGAGFQYFYRSVNANDQKQFNDSAGRMQPLVSIC